jgi:hypothetical protein
LFEVVIQNAQGETETLHTTAEHPFWVTNAQDGAQWLKASLLAAGMQLIDRSGNTLTVQSQTALNETATVYNIQVQEHSTYHVGHLGTWVHNANCCNVPNGAGNATTSPVDMAHTIGADYNPNTGNVTGGHSTLNGDVRVTGIVNPPDANGVYQATVQMQTPSGTWIAKTSNGGVNTMFPSSWDAAKIQAEINSAWNAVDKTVNGNKWSGTSSSGVKIEGYIQPRTTAYPIHSGG